MRQIPLTRGLFALVDDVDHGWLNQWKWTAVKKSHASYATHYFRQAKKVRAIAMHRLILGLNVGDGQETDHIDGNGLNNQRSNLRICTHQENLFNKKPYFTKTKISKFKGLVPYTYKNSIRGWVAKIGYNGQLIYLGSFIDETIAAKAYDRAAEKLFGEFARLNFPK